jgi:hypothetical protein
MAVCAADQLGQQLRRPKAAVPKLVSSHAYRKCSWDLWVRLQIATAATSNDLGYLRGRRMSSGQRSFVRLTRVSGDIEDRQAVHSGGVS